MVPEFVIIILLIVLMGYIFVILDYQKNIKAEEKQRILEKEEEERKEQREKEEIETMLRLEKQWEERKLLQKEIAKLERERKEMENAEIEKNLGIKLGKKIDPSDYLANPIQEPNVKSKFLRNKND